MKAGVNGVTADTPKKILFGAGTIHKNLKYTENAWNFTESVAGATNGGSKLSIVPELVDIPVDGATVPVKGLKKKVGETAAMDVNFAELSEDIVVSATLGEIAESSDVSTHNLIQSKADIEDGDYWENVAFVGKTLKGKDIIAILENPLITSGLENEGKNKEGSVGAYTFTCHADLEDEDLTVLPWKIYYPKA